MVIRVSDKKKNYSKVTKLLVKPYNLLKNKNVDLITPIVITNSNEFKILSKAQGIVRAKDNLLKLKKV